MTTTKKSNWGWGIFALYGSFVILMLGLVVYVSTTDDSLVEDNYYQKELAYQQQINRKANSIALPERLTWELDATNDELRIQFPVQLARNGVGGTVNFFRPSDASMDHSVPIDPDTSGMQSIPTASLSTGLWRMKVNWTCNGKEYFDEDVLVVR